MGPQLFDSVAVAPGRRIRRNLLEGPYLLIGQPVPDAEHDDLPLLGRQLSQCGHRRRFPGIETRFLLEPALGLQFPHAVVARVLRRFPQLQKRPKRLVQDIFRLPVAQPQCATIEHQHGGLPLIPVPAPMLALIGHLPPTETPAPPILYEIRQRIFGHALVEHPAPGANDLVTGVKPVTRLVDFFRGFRRKPRRGVPTKPGARTGLAGSLPWVIRPASTGDDGRRSISEAKRFLCSRVRQMLAFLPSANCSVPRFHMSLHPGRIAITPSVARADRAAPDLGVADGSVPREEAVEGISQVIGAHVWLPLALRERRRSALPRRGQGRGPVQPRCARTKAGSPRRQESLPGARPISWPQAQGPSFIGWGRPATPTRGLV
jgi:hypothetical protein